MNKQEMINYFRDMADWIECNNFGNEDVEYLKKIANNLQTEQNPIQDIVKLNEERYGLSFDSTQAYSKMYEELEEFKEADLNNDLDGMADSLGDQIVICVGELRKMGYNPELVLNEIVKEISSREQDPDQAKRWNNGEKEDGEKWQKSLTQDQKTLYKSDFEKARLKGDK